MPMLAPESSSVSTYMTMQSAGHERHEAEVVAEAAQRRRKSPQARIAAAAVIARVVVDADEVAARDADDRSGRLALEHDLEA